MVHWERLPCVCYYLTVCWMRLFYIILLPSIVYLCSAVEIIVFAIKSIPNRENPQAKLGEREALQLNCTKQRPFHVLSSSFSCLPFEVSHLHHSGIIICEAWFGLMVGNALLDKFASLLVQNCAWNSDLVQLSCCIVHVTMWIVATPAVCVPCIASAVSNFLCTSLSLQRYQT